MAGDKESDTKTSLQDEIERVKNIYGNCKAIWDAGDFMCIITVIINDVSIKLMISDSYPVKPAEIVVRGKSLSSGQCEELTEKLKTQKDLVLMMNFVQEWLESHGCVKPEEPQSGGSHAKKHYRKNIKGKHKRKGRKFKDEDSDEEQTEKKSSMKTAIDVISRIQWDEALEQENFTVGYIDRFIGVVEKNFTAFSWLDIASVDYNTLAIPKHRIEYFKYKQLIVWEKKSRLDNVFGSTGSNMTIIDVINDYEKLLDEEMKNSPTTPKEPVETGHDALSESTDSEDEDDNFTITVGQYDENTIKSAFASSAAAQADWEDSSQTRQLYPREKYWGPKNRPTHFLCLRITDPDLIENITKVHDEILSLVPEYHDALLPAPRLHVTLGCLGLDNVEQVSRAADILHRLKPDLQAFNPKSMHLSFQGVDNFFHSVLFAKVHYEQSFLDFVNNLREMIQAQGVVLRDIYEYHPHMTLVKLKGIKKHQLKTPYLDGRLYAAFQNHSFGKQVIDNIWLCEMSDTHQVDGFYISPAHIEF